ncbi:putative secreted protein (Por secretion system target) [Flavobacteriaceae bacterium MAR_2010_105]|nr:putative secreted protein (Por secretion system target) [Flavobacteriaceae bacterium MAR_2010_105]
MKITIPILIYVFCSSAFAQSYSGGAGDGFALETFININAPNIYSGGIGDGFVLETYLNTDSSNIFSGGVGDGFAIETYTNTESPNIFTGGVGDGFVLEVYINTVSPNIYAGGNGDGFDVGIFLGDPLGLNEALYKTTYMIYPNPASQYINLSFSRNISNYQVIIYDLMGKIVSSTLNTSSISISNFSTGNYIVQIKDIDSNVKVSKKLIIE